MEHAEQIDQVWIQTELLPKGRMTSSEHKCSPLLCSGLRHALLKFPLCLCTDAHLCVSSFKGQRRI